MRDDRPSRTAQGVLAERAVLHALGVIDDRFAAGLLTPGMARIVSAVHHGPAFLTERSVTLAGLAARINWFDMQVIEALDAGIDQVAVIGAGYDSRAWRFARDGVRYFELDHPATQADKVARAPSDGPTYVAVDLTVTTASDALTGHGLDDRRPTFFVVEGVTMYLTKEVLHRALVDLRKVAAVGSRLSVNFSAPGHTGTARNRRQLLLQRMARIGSAEGFRLEVDRVGAGELVADAGWEVASVTGLRAAARHLPDHARLAVDAVNDQAALVLADRT